MRAALIALPFVVLSAGAFAADLPARAAPPLAVAPLFTWTGFYGGLFAGYGTIGNRAESLCIDPAGARGGSGCAVIPSIRPGVGDFIAGSEIGYNYQLPDSNLVLGVEGDMEFARLRGYGSLTSDFPVVGGGTTGTSYFHAGQRLDSLGTLRGRVGYAFDRTLVYATGGVAAGNVRIETNASFLGLVDFDARKSDFRVGYVVGGGVEHAFSDRLSTKIEALYYDLGDRTVSATDPAGATGFRYGSRVETSGVMTRVGLNYKLGSNVSDVLPGLDIITDLFNPKPFVARAPSIWDFETGERYFYSTGSHRFSLGDPTAAGQLNSRLDYGNVGAHSGESFARLDHNPTGLFLKGFLGSGFITSGKLHDEDFPPIVAPYSNTVHTVKDGDIAYAAIDAGYTFWKDDTFRLGAFAGYQYFSELANGFGCNQVAGGTICAGAGAVANNVKVLSEDAHWNAMRIGLTGEVRYDRFKLALEGAYLPLVDFTGYDRHWLRPDINPVPQRGSGDGYFLQGIVSYDLTPTVSVGVGARYWKMNADSGRSQFPFPGTPASPTRFETDRYGGFVQITQKLPDFGLGSLVTK